MDTLVLDQGYSPVARVSWTRAVTLLFRNRVEVVEEYSDWTVRSVTLEMKVPSVIRSLHAIRHKKRGVRFSREHVYARDNGRCQYCQRTVGRGEATYDHVTPRSQGGHTRWENIVIACLMCNQKKGGRTPQQAGMLLHSKPVKPRNIPEATRITMMWQTGMPPGWKQWLRDYGYWNVELESDGP